MNDKHDKKEIKPFKVNGEVIHTDEQVVSTGSIERGNECNDSSTYSMSTI